MGLCSMSKTRKDPTAPQKRTCVDAHQRGALPPHPVPAGISSAASDARPGLPCAAPARTNYSSSALSFPAVFSMWAPLLKQSEYGPNFCSEFSQAQKHMCPLQEESEALQKITVTTQEQVKPEDKLHIHTTKLVRMQSMLYQDPIQNVSCWISKPKRLGRKPNVNAQDHFT